MTLWSGRFTASMSQALWELSESYPFDHVLYHHDIMGSKAHVEGLAAAGLVTDAERTALLAALDEIESEFDRGVFVRGAGDEDVHMAIERRATELAGETGAKLHTARSRNDQVATTLRLFTRDAVAEAAAAIVSLIGALVELGDRQPAAHLPGYTHLQRAQPVLLSHHLQAHAWALLRDVDRLLDARDRLNLSPLGAGALAGTSLPIRPDVTAELLGFTGTVANSLDAVSDRDFVAEVLFDLALLGVHLSRMGEELVLWTSAEFAFATLGDQFTTGSSMLPQKKNSDVAELARGKSGRLVGNLTALLVTLKGLPLSYNRDLQEDKEPLLDSLSQVGLILPALAGAYRSLEFRADVAERAAADEFLVAIDVAERMVEGGTPFRQAHERVGGWVAEALAGGLPFSQVVAGHDDEGRYAGLFEPGAALERRRSPGASGPLAAAAQRERLDA
ncbi:MAG: argininosuccinate lyase, partial [Acidobacteriota bacterium]|nr:argininosuccinate lyase [Acidobacteriota bacterium]